MIRAVFGGSFDPAHNGHLKALLAIRARGLAQVIHVVPAWRSPHKSGNSESAEHRLEMARLAFGGRPGIRVESLEVERGEPSYSADTLAALKTRHPGDEFRLVLGADQLKCFASWHRPDEILAAADLIVLARQSGSLEVLCDRAGVSRSSCHLLADFDEPVSASAIRARLAAGQDASDWLDPAVGDYIQRHGLYLP